MDGEGFMPQKRQAKTASLKHEREYFAQGVHHIFGIDEAGQEKKAATVAADKNVAE